MIVTRDPELWTTVRTEDGSFLGTVFHPRGQQPYAIDPISGDVVRGTVEDLSAMLRRR
ncbi:MAG: hypothetical protein ACRECT_00275 [Thermoplasmata archaeon]